MVLEDTQPVPPRHTSQAAIRTRAPNPPYPVNAARLRLTPFGVFLEPADGRKMGSQKQLLATAANIGVDHTTDFFLVCVRQAISRTICIQLLGFYKSQ